MLAMLMAFVAPLTGCLSLMAPDISVEHKQKLTLFVHAYHYCVAQTAARIDDGRSPIGDIATLAMDHCRPEERDITAFLVSIQAPEWYTARYIDDLHATAVHYSASMLRRGRIPDQIGRPI